MTTERITDPCHPLYREAMKLYAISFPAHEQREPLSQSRILRDSAYHFDVVLDGDTFIGEILYWEVSGALYIERFCVSPSLRNRHYGQKILTALQKQPLILENDPPTDATSLRRKGFYERCGFVANPFRRIHPPYHRKNAGHELILMSFPDTLTNAEFQNFREFLQNTVMKEAY